MEEIIKTEMLTKIYNPLSQNPKLALDQISLSIKEGEFITIMGKSGSGKTTLLNILSTIDDLTKGKLFIYGKNIFEMSDSEKAHFRKENIGFIFQNFNLLDTLTIRENIQLPLKLAKKKVNQEDKITVIMVTHDPLDAAYSSQMYYIEDGKIKDHLMKNDDSFDTYFSKIVKISMEL